MSPSRTLYVGMDVHTESMAVAAVAQAHGAEVVSLGTVGTRHGESDKLLRQLRSKSTPLVVVYAAGPCGDGRARAQETRRRLLGRRPLLDAQQGG